MELELLTGPLEVSGTPGLETTDPRMSDVATLVQAGDYLEAANQSREILQEKIYDIRIIGYFLYGHYVEYGLPALGEIFSCLDELVAGNLEAIGPARNKAKQIKNTLGWLVRTLSNNLEYEEGQRSEAYSGWQSTMSPDQVDAIIAAIEQLEGTVGTAVEDGAAIVDGLTKLRKWLYPFRDALASEAAPAEEEEPAASEEYEEAGPARTAAHAWTEPSEIVSAFNGLAGSHHLRQLIVKLDAFDRLITAGKLASAAVVADDINGIIANFDPRLYLPGLFVKYVVQTAGNINSLVAYSQYKQSPAWAALQQLYKVDIESFIAFDSDSLDFSGEMPYSDPGSGGERHEDEY